MPHDVRLLTEADLKKAVRLDLAAVDVVERAFTALAGGQVVMPPVLSMALPAVKGEVDVKTAYIPGFDGFAIKVSPGFFDNPGRGLPSLNGLMIVLSANTGLVEAIFLDNGYLTNVRTAAAGAVAAKYLAPETVHCAGVLGTGLQARLQLQAAHLIRPFRKALVYGRDPAKAETCAADLRAVLGVEVVPVNEPARVLWESQLVITATPSTAPILEASWLHQGLHITAVGSDASDKNELEPEVLARADLYVADRVSQCAVLGELRAALAAGVMTQDEVIELGAIATGSATGRTREVDITICDLTGTGAQDTAIAVHALAVTGGLGATIWV